VIKIEQLDQEMILFLQHYLTINTSQPNPDYESVCAIFKTQAEMDGFLYKKIMLSSGKPVIIITYAGINPSLPSLLLNHHMDVVPALNTQQWKTPPFEGIITNNIIIGRGVQDMKGVGVIHYFALKALKNAGIQPTRTIHFLAVPDEEIGGFTGTQEFIKTDFFKTMNVHTILDEGIPSGKPNTIAIKVSERKPIQIEIITTGSLAHSSKLNCFNAIHELTSLLHKITSKHYAQQKESLTITEGLLLSMNITSLQAGVHHNNKVSLNMVPDSARATIDIRVPPTMKMDDALHFIKTIINEHTHSNYIIHATVPDQEINDDYRTPLYNALEQTIKDCNIQPEPLFFEGSSDLRYYKALGLDGVGLTPFTTQNAIHETNESLPISDLIQGKNILIHFLKNFCFNKENHHD
jgi:aminoacylase